MLSMHIVSSLGERCAEAVLRRIDQQAVSSSNRMMLDQLPAEAAAALFDALIARSTHEVVIPIFDDAGQRSEVRLAALRRPNADLVPFFVDDSRGKGLAGEGGANRGSEGFASCLRDYYAAGAERPRHLLTITPRGNETQRSAQDAHADQALIDLRVLLHSVLDEHGATTDDPLRRVADIYLSFQKRDATWQGILDRWERYVDDCSGQSPAEQGARLPQLGCFFPDASENFATGDRAKILPDSEDRKRRRPGDPLSDSRLFDNALLRGFLGDVFNRPIEDPEHLIGELFGNDNETAQAVLKDGPAGFDRLDFGQFASMAQTTLKRNKNAFLRDQVVVEGALFFQSFDQHEERIVVIAAPSAVRLRVGLERGFNGRKEHAQLAHWNGQKADPREMRVADGAREAVFPIPAPPPGGFAVYRVALTRGPRSLRNPIDSFLVGVYGTDRAEILVEENRRLSLENQAWVAEGEVAFVRYTPGSAPEPIVVTEEVVAGTSPVQDDVEIRRVAFAESTLKPLIIGERAPEGEDGDDTGTFEYERLLELAAYTVKIGDRCRDVFRAASSYLDAIRQIEETGGTRWRIDLEGGISREIHAARSEALDTYVLERAVARLLSAPDTLALRCIRAGVVSALPAVDPGIESWGHFIAARRKLFDEIATIARRYLARYRRNLPDAGVPVWLLPLHGIAGLIEAYVTAWCAVVDDAVDRSARYDTLHDHLLQLDTLVVEEGGRVQRVVLLPTSPWMLAALGRYQALMAQNFAAKGSKPPLRRDEVEQLVPKTAIEDWYLPHGGGQRLRLADSAPFHLEFLPEDQFHSRATLDYVERIVANKVERYLRMHPHLRNERRTLRIGFINPGDGFHLLNGLRRWLDNLMRERRDGLRILPSGEIPSFDVFLFSSDGRQNEVGSAFEQFFREQVNAADEDAIQQTMVSRLRYRKSGEHGPTSPADAVHICFVHGLVDANKQANKTGSLTEWWDGGFGDGLLATYLRRTMSGASGQLQSRRGLWLDSKSRGLRGTLARIVALQRGCRDSDLDPSKAIYWECPLPDVAKLGHIYQHSDWVVHLDRELSLELFTKHQGENRPTIIEYTDQEVPDSPGFDTITVTKYSDPYREQLGEILTTVALDIHGRGDAAKRAADRILDDINALSGSWALDFLMGSIAGKSYSLRLKGNVGSALVYRWLKRVEQLQHGLPTLDSNIGPVVPVLVSLEDLLRVTPATGLPIANGLVERYTNEVERDDKGKPKESAKYCDDLLVLYIPATVPGSKTRLHGRVIEVKFGTTATSAREKAIAQIRTTHDLLQKHLGGAALSVDALFRHKQLSLLIKSQLEQSVAMGVLDGTAYDFLNVPALSANLATGNYEVDYTLGVDGQHVLGDAFLLDTREPQGPAACRIEMDNGVRIITLPRRLVEWLTFELDASPTLLERPVSTMPQLGRYENVKTQAGSSRRATVVAVDAPAPPSPRESPSPLLADLIPLPAAKPKSFEQLELAAVAGSDSPTEMAVAAAGPVEDQVESAIPSKAPNAEVAPAPVVVESLTLAPDQAPRVSLDEAMRTPVKEAPYPDSAVVEAVTRMERALRGHKVRLASPPSVREADRGPRLLRVYLRLEPGETINTVRRISEDLARDVGAASSDLHIANVTERNAVGVDLPLRGLTYTVNFPELVAHASFAAAQEEMALGLCAGIDVTGRPVWADLAQMPHMLVAGTTGSGKTVFLRNVILTLLMHNAPDRLQLRLSSSKPMDFRIFTSTPHAGGVGMATDAAQALALAQQLVTEMDRRITLIDAAFCDNLAEYNRDNRAQAEPYIVAVFDEYAEMIASFGDKQERSEFETTMGRLAQKARAAGIHLIICMQRPDANALKGAIKANILHRFALKLPQQHDSQIILDEGGAETLLGQGDLLYRDASNRVYRLQVPNLENSYLKDVLRRIGEGKGGAAIDLDASRTCPKCGRTGTIRELFGTRRMRHQRRDGSEVVTERAQSYCRFCRSGPPGGGGGGTIPREGDDAPKESNNGDAASSLASRGAAQQIALGRRVESSSPILSTVCQGPAGEPASPEKNVAGVTIEDIPEEDGGHEEGVAPLGPSMARAIVSFMAPAHLDLHLEHDNWAEWHKEIGLFNHFIPKPERIRNLAERVVRAVLVAQLGMFEGGLRLQAPLNQLNVGQQVGITEASVSRIVRGIEIEYLGERLPLAVFFCHPCEPTFPSGVETLSANQAKVALLQALVKEPDASDAKLETILRARGILIARRTINKYRDKQMEIPKSFEPRPVRLIEDAVTKLAPSRWLRSMLWQDVFGRAAPT